MSIKISKIKNEKVTIVTYIFFMLLMSTFLLLNSSIIFTYLIFLIALLCIIYLFLKEKKEDNYKNSIFTKICFFFSFLGLRFENFALIGVGFSFIGIMFIVESFSKKIIIVNSSKNVLLVIKNIFGEKGVRWSIRFCGFFILFFSSLLVLIYLVN